MSVDREQVRREPTVQRQETERDAAMRWRKRAEQAERERDEAKKALRHLAYPNRIAKPNGRDALAMAAYARDALAAFEQAQEQR